MRSLSMLAVALAACGSTREWTDIDMLGSAAPVYAAMPDLMRAANGEAPDLVTHPGDPGHLEQAQSRAGQRHYYAAALDTTIAIGELDVEGEVLEQQLLATYRGRPPYAGGDLTVHPKPALLLIDAPDGWWVRVGNEKGESRTWAGAGTRRFQVTEGRWFVRRVDGSPEPVERGHPIDVEAGTKVLRRLTPEGLAAP